MKKNKKSIKWLYNELPELVSENIISEDSASKLKERYGEVNPTDPMKIVLIIFGIIGSVLIGGGVILILAHNWTDMPRPVRAFFSFLPLIAAQLIAGYVITRRSENTAWKESSGAFLMLALGSAIALVGQTYHVSGNLGSFLFTWMLLSLPVIYLLNSATSGLFYLAGIITWMIYKADENANPAFFLVFFALIIPYLIIQAIKNRYSIKLTILLWGLMIILPIAAGIGLDYMDNEDLWYVCFSSIFSIFYLTGNLWFNEKRFFWQKPLQTVGSIGLFVMVAMFAFEDFWFEFNIHKISSYRELTSLVFHIMIFATSIILLGVAVFKKRFSLLFFGLIPVVAGLCGILSGLMNNQMFPMVLFNVYMLVLGITTIITGIKSNKLGKMNSGMFILAVLIIMRFFDADANILIKGIAFIIIGVGFLMTNILIVRKQSKKLKTAGGGSE